MDSIAKVLMLSGTSSMFYSALVPPKRAKAGRNGPGSIYKGQPFEFLVRYLAYIACIIIPASAFCHSLLLLYRVHAFSWAKPIVPWLCPPHPDALDPLVYVSRRFLVGIALVISGTLLRVSAYQALGSLFTYEVFVKDNHKLITAGPYKFVRHPSYTGLALLFLGTHLIHFGPGAYATYCDIASTPMAVCIYYWRYAAPFAIVSVIRRCSVEDGQLRERFGGEWEKYKEEVPYALVPFVY